jgi:hypothetical protein
MQKPLDCEQHNLLPGQYQCGLRRLHMNESLLLDLQNVLYNTYTMKNTLLEPIILSDSSNMSFAFEWVSGEKHISISWTTDVKLFFLIYDATIKLVIDVMSEKCSVSCAAIVVSAWNISSSLDLSVTLKVSHTKADIYALSLLGNNAKAVVNGGVVIDPWLIQAEGYLSEENLLLGEKIQIKALPMLDVRSNDVKASHWSKIERLDEQKLFYLHAKWLSPAAAKHLMIQSYIQKALDHGWEGENNEIIEKIFTYLA